MSERSYKEPDLNKVNSLVEHLLSSPGIKSEHLLAGEKMITDFFHSSLPKLKALFKSGRFFPHLEPEQVLELVSGNLYSRASGVVLPVFNRFIDDTDFTFMDKFSDSGAVSEKFRKKKLHEFVLMLFSNRDSRFRMYSTFNIFYYSVIEKYMEEIFKRRNCIYNGLAGFYESEPDLSDNIILIKTMLLVRNWNNIKSHFSSGNRDVQQSSNDTGNDRERIFTSADSAAEQLIPLLPGIPERFIRTAVKPVISDDMSEKDEVFSRLIFIMDSRYRNYRHISQTDRGAESADKSWFAIALKNAGHFGYDRQMLDALYHIAGDNNW